MDADWYRSAYQDVAASGEDPDGALTTIMALGRAATPGAYFSTAYYLAHHPDVAQSGLNPLLH